MSRSAFATLLQRSKFASFDPRISQVYTAHGGDAHRGHWGFKRPLPLSRRGAYVTVKNVDTPEYQTEWNSAEPQALWIKNWDELKLSPQKPWLGDDAADEHIIDSDFVPQSPHWRQPCLPNLDVMTRGQFALYLQKIRASRTAFLKQRNNLTAHQLGNTTKSRSSPWSDLIAIHFSHQRRSNPRSREIEHLPHSSGGLSYAHYSPLQTFLMTRERKGRLADDHRAKDNNLLTYVASFAGMAGRVARKHTGLTCPVVWDDPSRTGEVMIRPHRATVKSWPIVVGQRQGLKAAKVMIDLRVWDEQSHFRSNPHPPGSPAYVAAEPPRSIDELNAQAAVNRAGERKKMHVPQGKTTLGLLKSAMAKSNPHVVV